MGETELHGLAASIVLRARTPLDPVHEITDLLHKAYAALAAAGFRYMATHQGPDVTRRRMDAGDTTVAVDGGRIVGIITLKPPAATRGSSFYDRDDVASFGQFAVRPSHQGRGIGRRLLDLVEQRAADLDAAFIALDTAEGARDLISMYERRGYRFIEHADWNVTNYRSVILAKRVRAAEG